MNTWTEIIVGLVLIIIAVLVWSLTVGAGFWDFGSAAWTFLKGGLVWLVILIGTLFIVLGISDLKD